MTTQGLLERLSAPGPKRVLSLDGGGIRGALSIQFLARIERLLRQRYGRNDLTLADYFDLIGGTSTGAIIAAALATGMDTEELERRYLELGEEVFRLSRWRRLQVWKKLRVAYEAGPLRKMLASCFGDARLGGETLRTGLCVFSKRADTNSTWPLLNHPNGRYYEKNKGLLLRDVVRASTAAPTFFIPETLDVGNGEVGEFVDGAVSMAQNPALLLFMVATLQGFPFRWERSTDSLLLVSVGTGVWERRAAPGAVKGRWMIDWAKEIPKMLIHDANWYTQAVMQYIARPLVRWPIDREIGDMREDGLHPDPALSYVRYDVTLEKETLEELDLEHLCPKLHLLRDLSAGTVCPDHVAIGERESRRQVSGEHFPSAFDLGAEG